ncbi:MAG: hypothetical protein EBZ49_01755 [Proteobacteria bacterium]|nr:hypothetical protein [Pseudomonadota bacterium]
MKFVKDNTFFVVFIVGVMVAMVSASLFPSYPNAKCIEGVLYEKVLNNIYIKKNTACVIFKS